MMVIDLYFGCRYQNNMKLDWREIIQKYGVRVHNGDKVLLRDAVETETTFEGYADGIGGVGEIFVRIEKSDVARMRDVSADGEWEGVYRRNPLMES